MFYRGIAVTLMAGSLFAQSTNLSLRYATKLGGSDHDAVAGVAVDSSGNTWVAGSTASLDFPVTKNAVQPHPGGSSMLLVDASAASWSFDPGLSLPSVVAASSAQPGLVFEAGAKGIHKSADAGVTWAALPGSPFAYSLAADPVNPALVYAGNGDGLYKSADQGVTWTLISSGIPPSGNSHYIGTIAIDPANPSILLAQELRLVFRSSDAGTSWTQVLDAGSGSRASVLFDASRPGVAFALTGNQIQKSMDGGATWAGTGYVDGAGSLFADPFHPGTLYASGYMLAQRSTDDGMTWAAAPALTGQTDGFPFAADMANKTVYAGQGTFIVRSSDGFSTAQPVGPAQTPTVISLSVGPASAGGASRLYAATDVTSDLFIAKLDPAGNVLYATYFGGSADDYANGIAVDSAGSVYVTGTTRSADFPVTPGAYQTRFPITPQTLGNVVSPGASFILKLAADGTLGYSTYFADAKTSLSAIAVNSNGEAYVTGASGGDLPVTAGAYQSALSPACGFVPCPFSQPGLPVGFVPPPMPATNVVLARFDASGSNLLACTYYGDGRVGGNALAVDPDGNAFLVEDGNVVEFNASASSLLAIREVPTDVKAIALDANRNVYIAGQSVFNPNYPSPIFTTPGAFQTAPSLVNTFPGERALNSGAGDAYIAKLNPDLSFQYATLLGGATTDGATGIAVDSLGQVTVVGFTAFDNFPLKAPLQQAFAPLTGFLARLSPDLSQLVYSTYVGDTNYFQAQGVALDSQGNAIFAGFTFTSQNQLPPGTYSGSQDVFVARIDAALSAIELDSIVNAASLVAGPIAPNETVLIRGQGFNSNAQVLLDGVALPSVSASSGQIAVTVPASYQQKAGGAATFQIQSGSSTSNSVLVPVALTAPGVYTVNGSGTGPSYILNADGTLNSPSNPTSMGSIVTVLATGVGMTSVTDGYAIPQVPVNVFIDGFFCNGVEAFLAPIPGLPGTVFGITVYVPNPTTLAAYNPNLVNYKMPPTVAVDLQVNGVFSQPGLSIAIAQ